MTIIKKLTALALILAILLSLGMTAQAAGESTDDLVRRLINYFQYYQGDARLDYELILAEIEKQDPLLAVTWANILDFWTNVNEDMEFPSGVLPDGLPEDDSLCIVVMGYYLKSNGSMRDELIDRLEVTLASAQKYPNAYILCTGGGTAADNGKVTEAGQMAKWLIQKGIASERVIVEDNALSTIENAIYGCRLLYRDYPQVKNIAVITSDYHIYRSCLYFHTQAALDAYEAGDEPIRVISNATCRIKPGASKELETQVEGIGMLTGLDVEDMSKPRLSKLDHLTVTGPTEYAYGAEPALTVTAAYTSGYTRDVTADSNFSGFDFAVSGFQTVHVSYEEGGIQKSTSFEVYVIPPETAPAQPPAEVPTEPAPESPVQTEEPSRSLLPALSFAGVCVLLLIILLFLKAKHAKKRRRRPRPTIKLEQ